MMELPKDLKAKTMDELEELNRELGTERRRIKGLQMEINRVMDVKAAAMKAERLMGAMSDPEKKALHEALAQTVGGAGVIPSESKVGTLGNVKTNK